MHQRGFRFGQFEIGFHLRLHLLAARGKVTGAGLQLRAGGFGVGFELGDGRFQLFSMLRNHIFCTQGEGILDVVAHLFEAGRQVHGAGLHLVAGSFGVSLRFLD